MAVRFDPCPESRQLGISMIVMVLLIKLCGLFDVKPFYMSAGKKNTSNQIFGDVFKMYDPPFLTHFLGFCQQA